jgi:ParB family chromosome partitioning protein
MNAGITDLELDQLEPDPANVRKVFRGIEALAESILEVGLLHNLVVRPGLVEGKFFIAAGERRYRALKILAERGQWIDPVPCKVIPGDGSLPMLHENEFRSDVPVWHRGFKYLEMQECGYSQHQIAHSLGKGMSYVNLAIQIARGLAPRVVRALDDAGGESLSVMQILAISKLIDRNSFEADEKAQLKELERVLRCPRRKTRSTPGIIPEKQRVWQRYQNLKARRQMRIPGNLVEVIDALVRYLNGTDPRLNLPDV